MPNLQLSYDSHIRLIAECRKYEIQRLKVEVPSNPPYPAENLNDAAGIINVLRFLRDTKLFKKYIEMCPYSMY